MSLDDAPASDRTDLRQAMSTAGPTPDGAAVRLTGLYKSFGHIQAVRGVDLTIVPGEVVAVLGPNGAGKSTTIDMLLGLTRPDAGTAQLFGTDPVAAVHAGRVGAMLQAGALLPDVTVGEIVRTVALLHHRPMPAARALDLAGVADLAKQRTNKLSGGQAQRVRFALALVSDPDLLVLDEPTVGMDVEVRRAFWSSMREFSAQGRTVMFATHYLEEADDFADRVVVLADGRIAADGTGAALKATVAGRTLSAVVPGASPEALRSLAGVQQVQAQGPRWVAHCTDSDVAVRDLLTRFPAAYDIEITTGNLEDAFLELTTRTDDFRTETAS